MAAVSAIGILLTYLGCTRWWGALLSVGTLLWFAAPGVILTCRLLQGGGAGVHWLIGPVWGLALSTAGLLALWEVGFTHVTAILVAPWPIWLLITVVPWRRFALSYPLLALDRRDLVAVAVLFLLLPVVAGLPYANVAAPTEGGGRAYRAYFTADFVWAMTVVAEVSKGELPPHNPFKLDDTLHYYWLSHFLSAAHYRGFGRLGLRVEEVVLANSIGYTLAFLVFLYGLVRAFGSHAWAACAACALVFVANSFEALDRIVVWWNEPSLAPLLTDINIDAVTRWFYSSMPVDGLQRMILYQPHHLTGYAIGLSALLIVARVEAVQRRLVAFTAGCLLGLSLLLTSFTALMLGVAVALVYAARLLWARRWGALPACAVAGAIPIAAAYWTSMTLQYIDSAQPLPIGFGWNPVAVSHWPYAVLISFGPMLILGLAGAVIALIKYRRETWPVLMLAAVAVAFYFLADVPDMEHVWVGWRSGHVLFIACAVLTGLTLTSVATSPMTIRIGAYVGVAVLAMAALPTTAVDIYNAQDVANARYGPGFPWTLGLSGQEVEALEWLKTRTPRDVVVQPDVRERGVTSWGYIPAFAERRMAAGLPIAMVPMQPYRDATEVVGEQIFSRGSPEHRSAVARRLGIDYIYAGPAEQRAHPDFVAMLDARSDLFPVAFRNAEVVIYWVAP